MPGRFRLLRATPRRDRESGQALLELALVVPIIVILALAIFQFAYVIESQMGLTNAVREAARRAAATDPNTTPVWTGSGSLAEWTQAQLCGDATAPCTGGLLELNVQGFDGALLAPDPPTVTICSYTAAGSTNYQIQATATYRHPLFFGLLAFATDYADGTQDGRWTLSSTAQMRLENVDPAAYPVNDPGACPP
jgi:hypothetical protein